MITDKQRLRELKKAEILMGRLAFQLGKASAVDAMLHLAKAHAELMKLEKDLK